MLTVGGKTTKHLYTRALNVIVCVAIYCDLDKVLIAAVYAIMFLLE